MNNFKQCIELLNKECKEIIYDKLKEKKNHKLVFFGASSLLKKLLNDLSRCGIYPDYICDNDIKKHGEKFESHTIYNPSILFNKNHKFIVLITSSFINEIRNQLSIYPNIQSIYAYNEINYLTKYKFIEQTLTKSIRQTISDFNKKPLISVVILLTASENEDWLELAINSILNQWYKNWEICITYNIRTNQKIVKYLQSLSNKKIKIKFLEENSSNSIPLEIISGEYQTIIYDKDQITSNALYEIVKVINETDADFIYSDEDKINFDGTFCEPHFKPDFSPEMLLSQNYISHLSVIRKSLILEVYKFTIQLNKAFEYDLYLKIVEKTSKIYHIPKVLYHSRKTKYKTSIKLSSIYYEKKAIQEALKRRNICATVLDGKYPYIYKINYDIKNQPLVSIIIPFKDKPELLKMCIDSILEKTTYENFQIIGISNNSEEKEIFDLMKKYELKDKRIKFYEHNVPFNYSEINNYAVKNYAKGEHIILLNNDIKMISPNWIEEMLMYSQMEDIGCVGAKLYYPNNTIQHGGVILGIYGCAGHSHKYHNYHSNGYFFRLISVQNVSAVTAACLMVKTEIYKELNGLNEIDLKIAFNDVDFCLRVQEKGYRNIFNPYCEAYHYESISRGKDNTTSKMNRAKKEILYIQERHSIILKNGDPFYNQNLTLIKEDFSLK